MAGVNSTSPSRTLSRDEALERLKAMRGKFTRAAKLLDYDRGVNRPAMLERLRRDPSDSVPGADPTPETAAVRLACLAVLQAGRWSAISTGSRATLEDSGA